MDLLRDKIFQRLQKADNDEKRGALCQKSSSPDLIPKKVASSESKQRESIEQESMADEVMLESA